MYRWEWEQKFSRMSAREQEAVLARNRELVGSVRDAEQGVRLADREARLGSYSGQDRSSEVDAARDAWQAASDALHAAQYEQGVGQSATYRSAYEQQQEAEAEA